MKLLSKLFYITLIALFFSSCASKRVVSSTTVNFSTLTYFTTEKNKELKLDFFKPNVSNSKTPLILYVHGGGFSGGNRNDAFIKEFANEMALNGIAFASISYRLTMKKTVFGCNVPSNLKIKAFDDAAKDIRRATDFLISNNDDLNFDASNIILMGSSAGAEAVLHLAFVQKNNIQPDFNFAGVIAYSGAISTLENISAETAIPSLLFHGVKDKLVPYDVAPHHYCKKNSKGYLTLFGSKAIADKLAEIDKSYILFTITNGDHSWNYKPMVYYRQEIIEFIKNQVVLGQFLQREVIKKENNHNSKEL